MKYFTGILIIILFDLSAGAVSLPVIKPASITRLAIQTDSTTESISFPLSLKPRDIVIFTGQKLTLKERIAFVIARHQLKREERQPGKKEIQDKGKTALILGLIGAVCLLIPILDLVSIPFAILAIVIGNKARREDRRDKKARIGVLLGTATLGILVLVGLIVAIVLTVGSVPM